MKREKKWMVSGTEKSFFLLSRTEKDLLIIIRSVLPFSRHHDRFGRTFITGLDFTNSLVQMDHSNNTWHFQHVSAPPHSPPPCVTFYSINNYFTLLMCLKKESFIVKYYFIDNFLLPTALKSGFKRQKKFRWHFGDHLIHLYTTLPKCKCCIWCKKGLLIFIN